MLKIKTTKSFAQANKKTIACALMNLADFSTSAATGNKSVSEKEMEKCLYGDSPKKFKTKQLKKQMKKKI